MKAKSIDNKTWIKKHFQTIVDKYGGKYPYILVAAGKIFPIKAGDDIARIEREITKKYGKPIGMPVPQASEFLSILSFKR